MSRKDSQVRNTQVKTVHAQMEVFQPLQISEEQVFMTQSWWNVGLIVTAGKDEVIMRQINM